MSDDVETANVDSAEFDRVINVNLRGMFLCLKYELRQMLKQGGEGYFIKNVQQLDTAVQTISQATDLAIQSGEALSSIVNMVDSVP